MSGATRLLVASEIRRRGRTHLFAGGVFAAATAALLVLLGSVAGVEASIGGELDATLAGSWRLADGWSHELTEGFFVNDSTALAARAEAALGVGAAPRIEVQGIFLHTSHFEDFDAGLIVGVDPARDGRAADVAGRIVEGRFLDGENVWIGGKPYPQLVVGVQMIESLGMRVYDGNLSRANLLNVTAGRFASEGLEQRPVVKQGVVVGAFRTGFGPIDRYTVFLDIRQARELLRMETADDPANLILLSDASPSAVAAFAKAEGLQATGSRYFRDSYLAAVFEPLRAFGAVVTVVVLALAGGWVANVGAVAILTDHDRVAVLRALGMPTRLVLGPLAALVVAAGAAGAALGVAVAWGAARLLSAGGAGVPGMPDLALRVDLNAGLVAALAVAVLATAVLAALAAGIALRRIPITDALRR